MDFIYLFNCPISGCDIQVYFKHAGLRLVQQEPSSNPLFLFYLFFCLQHSV
uniref:Uncharacterized protein n=1 Tax=Anguilla anguilla TaxID=7936 RepID=A0A0E9WU86_ANGAN